MDEVRFRLKRGDFEVSLRGPQAWVDAQLDRALERWMAIAEGQAPEPPTQAVIRVATSPAEPLPKRASTPDATPSGMDLPRVSPDFRPKVNVTIAQFVAMKDATTPADVFIVGVYYLEKYRQQETFTLESLQTLLADVPAWECQRAEDVAEEVLVRGHVERLRDGRWSITFKGQNYVRDGLA